jgi:hypothetical protein
MHLYHKQYQIRTTAAICYHVIMFKALRLPGRFRKVLVSSGVTGEISAHGAKTNLESIDRLLALDPYVTFGIRVVEQAIKQKNLHRPQVIEVMAASLGITVERFNQPGPGYIDPGLTAERLHTALKLMHGVADSGGLVVLATAHPGSLASYYLALASFITENGGRVYRSNSPVKIAEYRWIDDVGGVHMLTDEGALMHTHDSIGFDHFLHGLPEPPALVIADHGYAGAAINHGLKTIALHDVDDPGIPLAAHLGANIVAIPMNDNQLNIPTATVIEAAGAASPA